MGACDQQDSPSLSSKSSIVNGEGTPCMRSVGGRVKKLRKRRSRAVAKPPIRLLSADKSTFRDIVLQLTGIPSTSSSPPLPPPSSSPLSLLASAHTTTPSYPFSSTGASPFDNPTYPQCLDPLPFANLMTPLSSSHISNSSSPTTPSSDSALLHSSPYPFFERSSQNATSEINLSKTLLFLQALKQSLLQLKSLESLLQIKSLEGCGSSNFGSLGHYNLDMNSSGGSNDGIDLEPMRRSQVDRIPKSINTYSEECVASVKLLDMEQLQNLQQAAELESFLLARDDNLDDLFTRKLLHNLNPCSFDTIHMHNLSLELGETYL